MENDNGKYSKSIQIVVRREDFARLAGVRPSSDAATQEPDRIWKQPNALRWIP